ncbi:MAG: radical SAM protein [Spirochaetales bacterium]|nr:radical SAM protein [Spirochaetales bacterium]
MRIVIVQPSIEDFYSTPHRLSALGGFSIMGLLEKQGHRVELINFPLTGRKPRKKTLPVWADHLEPHLMEERGPVSYFNQWRRWGPEPEEAARIIHEKSPDFILISLFAHAYSEEALLLARACKTFNPAGRSVPVAVGGAGVTVHPLFFTQENAIDLVLAGEGEVLFKDSSLDVLRDYALGGEKLIRADRYCSASDMIPLFSHTTGGRSHSQVAALLSRGCPRGCRFCSNHLTQGKKVRRLEPSVVEEAFGNFLRKSHFPPGKRLTLDLEDDNLLMNKDYLRSVLNRLIRVWEKQGRKRGELLFTAENGMDYELLDRGLLEELVQFGFRQFNFSLASADRGLLAQENRFFQPEKLADHLVFLKEKGIPVVTYFICGLAGDSRESIAKVLSFLFHQSTLGGISLFYPVPGLEGFTGPDPYRGRHVGLSRGSMAFPWNNSLTTETMITAFRLSRLFNLMKDETFRAEQEELISTICQENRLYTYNRHKKMIPVTRQDGDLVSLVLEERAKIPSYLSRKLFK